MKALDALRHIVEQSGYRPKAIARLTEQPVSAVKAALTGPEAPSIDQIITIANALGYELALVDVREVLSFDAFFLTRSTPRRYRKDRKRVASLEGPVVFDSNTIDLKAVVREQAQRTAKPAKKSKKGAKKAKGAKAQGAKAAQTGEVSVRISDARRNDREPEYTPSIVVEAHAIEPTCDPQPAPEAQPQRFFMKEPKDQQSIGSIPAILIPNTPMPSMPPDTTAVSAMPPMPAIPNASAMSSRPPMARASAMSSMSPMARVSAMSSRPFPAPPFPPEK